MRVAKTSLLILMLLTSMLGPSLASGAPKKDRELLMGISFSIPPYVITEENAGLELELLRESFAIKGYTVLPSYLPLARTFMNFEEGSLDGVINVKEGMVNGYYSDVVITFHNQAISLKEKGLKIDSIEDLSQKSIVAFQRASVILGPELAKAVQHNSEYNEVADQSLQVKQLFWERVDVVIMDRKIFKYFRRWLFDRSSTLKGEYIVRGHDLRRPIVYHNIFPPSEYRFAFLSEQVRDDFNQGLQAIKSSGIYDELLQKYDDDLELPLPQGQ